MNKGRDIQERTLEFACRVVRLHDHLRKRGYSGRTFGHQLLRCGTSIGAHLEEADAAESTADFICKCSIALKEARESHYWLRLLRKSGFVTAEKLDGLVEEANEIVAIITTILKNTRANANESELLIRNSQFAIRN